MPVPGAGAKLIGVPVARRFLAGEVSAEDDLGLLLKPTSAAVSFLVIGGGCGDV